MFAGGSDDPGLVVIGLEAGRGEISLIVPGVLP